MYLGKILTLGLDICIRGVHVTLHMEMYRRQLDMKSEVQERLMGVLVQRKGFD